MKASILCVCLVLSSILYGQRKLQIGLHINPVVNYLQLPKYDGNDIFDYNLVYFDYKDSKIGINTGLEFDNSLDSNLGFKINPSVIYQSMEFTQSRFPNNHEIKGIIHNEIGYLNFQIPILIYKKMDIGNKKSQVKIGAGFSLNMAHFNNDIVQWDLIVDTNLLSVSLLGKENKEFTFNSSGIAFISYNQKLEKYGAFEVGISFHQLFGGMPKYDYQLQVNEKKPYSMLISPRISYLSYDMIFYFGKHHSH
ncbi:MAG: hypothetical protein NTX03_10885 [Bacteroidetes bacterium]|nr:hypothetical protein [Bacteroidota bacterium]